MENCESSSHDFRIHHSAKAKVLHLIDHQVEIACFEPVGAGSFHSSVKVQADEAVFIVRFSQECCLAGFDRPWGNCIEDGLTKRQGKGEGSVRQKPIRWLESFGKELAIMGPRLCVECLNPAIESRYIDVLPILLKSLLECLLNLLVHTVVIPELLHFAVIHDFEGHC